MTKKILLLSFIYVSASIFAQKQNGELNSIPLNSKIIVDSIKISGNKITEEFIIRNELTFAEGDTVNSDILSFNKERIFSLGIFTDVKIAPRTENDIKYLDIIVRESWYIFPVPFIELKDNDWNKISYGADIFIQNFSGLNEKLRFHAGFGYDPNFLVSYYNPYIIKSSDISFAVNLSYAKVKNKSNTAKILYGSDFNQTVSGGEIALGKRLGLFQKIVLNFGYKVIETPEYIPGLTSSGDRIDHLFSAGFGYLYDTRDLIQFPREGYYIQSYFDFKGLNIDNINYQSLNIDVRKYQKITDDLSLKIRVKSRMTFGSAVPYYDFSYLGYDEKIRGYFFNEREGNSSYLTSVELNYPLIKDFNLNFDFIPLLPKELFSYRVAVYAELFADAGATKFKDRAHSIKSFDSGYGVGLTFLFLPYSAFRIEFAVNDRGKSQWILGFGTSF